MKRRVYREKEFLKGRRRSPGFTLTEIMVGLVIFAISIGGVTGAMVQGRKMLLEAENKEMSFSNAQSILERYLAMSYGDLEIWIGSSDSKTEEVAGTECSVSVDRMSMTAAAGKSEIPYFSIRVDCEYSDDGAQKKVALSGIIPYPYLQIFTKTIESPTPALEAKLNVEEKILSYTFTPAVKSDLMIFYDLSIDVETTAGTSINGTDLLITQCKITRKNTGAVVNVGIPTGTPILTQPQINNVVGVEGSRVFPGEQNTISIFWKKDHAGGKITLKKANLVVLRMENNK